MTSPSHFHKSTNVPEPVDVRQLSDSRGLLPPSGFRTPPGVTRRRQCVTRVRECVFSRLLLWWSALSCRRYNNNNNNTNTSGNNSNTDDNNASTSREFVVEPMIANAVTSVAGGQWSPPPLSVMSGTRGDG